MIRDQNATVAPANSEPKATAAHRALRHCGTGS